MKTNEVIEFPTPTGQAHGLPQELVELSVIVPRWQFDALVNTAQNRGVSAAQLVRRMISVAFDHAPH